MANRNQSAIANEAMRQRARERTKRSVKRLAAKKFADEQKNKPMRVRLGLTRV